MHSVVQVSAGDSVDVETNVDIEAGQVVVRGELVLVAPARIAAGSRGPTRRRGEFEMPKSAGDKIGQGDRLFWNAEAGVVEKAQGKDGSPFAGLASRAAGEDETTVGVLLGG